MITLIMIDLESIKIKSRVNLFRRLRCCYCRRFCQEWVYLLFQMAGQIDMNMQSDLMAAFEESL